MLTMITIRVRGFRGGKGNGKKLGIALTYLGLKSPMKIHVSESISNKPCQHITNGVTYDIVIYW